MNTDELIVLVDDFINRFYAGDIKIISPPEDMQEKEKEVNDVAREMAHALIRGRLTDEINLYVRMKSAVTARRLLKVITSARSQGMIIETESNNSKSKRLEQENIQLKEENAKLQKEIQRVNKLNEALHSVISRFEAKLKKTDDGTLGVP